MKESTKEKIKLIGGFAGAIGGSCASSFIVGALSAVNPVVGIPMIIGKVVTNTIIAERCATYIMNKTDEAINAYESISKMKDEIFESKNKDSEETDFVDA